MRARSLSWTGNGRGIVARSVASLEAAHSFRGTFAVTLIQPTPPWALNQGA